MTHDQREAQHAVEGIILRRIYEKRLQGFTIETAKEIVETLTASPGEQKPQPAAGWNEAIEAAINVVKPWPGAEGLAQSEAEKAVENIRREFVKALEALRRAAPAPEGVARPDAGGWVREALTRAVTELDAMRNLCAIMIFEPDPGKPHPLKDGVYDQRMLAAHDAINAGHAALSTPPVAAESKASVEARLRERVHFYRNHSDAPVYSGKHVANILETVFALAAVGDEANESRRSALAQSEEKK